LVNLKAAAKKKVDTINQGYESKIIEADRQFNQLLNENSQLAASLEVMRHQLSFLESQNTVLRADEGRSQSSFEEFTRGASAQLEMLNTQLEELTKESQKLREEEQRQKSKLANAEADIDRSLSGARKTVDQLESDLAQVKLSLNEAEAQGKALMSENSRLNSELTRVSVESKREVELKIGERDNEIRLLQGRLDEMRRNHIQQTGELQRVLLENKRHADKWRETAENVAIESEQGLEEAEQKTQQYAQKAAAYGAEIERQEAEAAGLQQVIAKKQQEARDLQAEYELVQRRLFDQKTQLDALYEQQLQFANERELTQNEIDKKKTEYRRLKREYVARVKQDEGGRRK
jgi:chromosome segregation ATPase